MPLLDGPIEGSYGFIDPLLRSPKDFLCCRGQRASWNRRHVVSLRLHLVGCGEGDSILLPSVDFLPRYKRRERLLIIVMSSCGML